MCLEELGVSGGGEDFRRGARAKGKSAGGERRRAGESALGRGAVQGHDGAGQRLKVGNGLRIGQLSVLEVACAIVFAP